MVEHLTPSFRRYWSEQPFAYQVRYAYHLSIGCERCWLAVNKDAPTEPLRENDPFLRAIARIQHPKVDLSLPSRTIRPLMHGQFRADDFPTLLLQESVAVSLDRQTSLIESRKPDESSLAVPFALAKLLAGTTQTKAAGIDLQINVACAAVDLETIDAERVDAALTSARALMDSSDPATEVNLLLAEFKVFCMKARVDSGTRMKMEALEKMKTVCHNGLPLILDDPVRRFEVICDLVRGVFGFDRDNLRWAFSDLELGSWGNEVHRLNGLFHKAQVASIAGFLNPDLTRSVVSHLKASLKSVDQCGHYYSLGRYYELLGMLVHDTSALEQAITAYEALEVYLPFLRAWKALDKICPESRSDISNRAYNAFGKNLTLRMVESVTGASESATGLSERAREALI